MVLIQKYLYNFITVKQYGGGPVRVVLHKCMRTPGLEQDNNTQYIPPGGANEEKLDENIRRAKSMVREYVLCNPWDYFATFTMDQTKFDRYDLKKYHSAFSQWLRNYNRIHDTNIRYLVIPEQHKDGAWHEHGFLMGLPREHLRPFTLQEKLPTYIRDKLSQGQEVLDWPAYRKKFGFCDFEPIRDIARASSYVLKYVTKDISRSVTELGAHLYYCSKGLQRATIIKQGFLDSESFGMSLEHYFSRVDFENDFVKLFTVNDMDIISDFLACIKSPVELEHEVEQSDPEPAAMATQDLIHALVQSKYGDDECLPDMLSLDGYSDEECLPDVLSLDGYSDEECLPEVLSLDGYGDEECLPDVLSLDGYSEEKCLPEVLCDYKLEPGGATCDVGMCRECSSRIAEGIDMCREHACSIQEFT